MTLKSLDLTFQLLGLGWLKSSGLTQVKPRLPPQGLRDRHGDGSDPQVRHNEGQAAPGEEETAFGGGQEVRQLRVQAVEHGEFSSDWYEEAVGVRSVQIAAAESSLRPQVLRLVADRDEEPDVEQFHDRIREHGGHLG